MTWVDGISVPFPSGVLLFLPACVSSELILDFAPLCPLIAYRAQVVLLVS